MDIQKAIRWVKQHAATDHCEASDDALAALQEQAKREKGCEWCNSDALESITVTHIFGLPKIAINTGGGVDESEKVRFCPHCGKRLK